MNWINVKDKMPEDEMPVLVWCEDKQSTGFHTNGIFQLSPKFELIRKSLWVVGNKWYIGADYDLVTHWKPKDEAQNA